MNKNDCIQYLDKICAQAGLDSKFLQAIISTESSWIPTANRFEINAAKYVQKPLVFASKNKMPVEVETIQQQTSLGLSQIMGYNFRWLGFTGKLFDMYNPQLNLDYMVKFFKIRCQKYESLEDRAAAYNGGTPRRDADGKLEPKLQAYADRVMGFYKQLT